jgi:hypothetical protein
MKADRQTGILHERERSHTMNTHAPSRPALDGLWDPSPDASRDGPRAIATRDRDVIRQWAARHHAEPGTGEATASGPATVHVQDGGSPAWTLSATVSLGLRSAKGDENRRDRIAAARAARSNRASGAVEAEQLFDPERA